MISSHFGQLISSREHSSHHLKIIGKEFQKIVIRRYLERSIQKNFFSKLHSLQIKTIFQEKSSFAKIYCRGICDLYLWS